MEKRDNLKNKIEELRKILNESILNKQIPQDEIMEMSRRLDKLIAEYMKMKKDEN